MEESKSDLQHVKARILELEAEIKEAKDEAKKAGNNDKKERDYWRSKEAQLQDRLNVLLKKEERLEGASAAPAAALPVLKFVRVPEDRTFVHDVEECSNLVVSGDESCPTDKLVGITDIIANCVQTVVKCLPQATDAQYRVPPLVISRLARGGKTTVLRLLFDKLKTLGDIVPIIITFNGNSNFERVKGETSAAAILRQIATQLGVTQGTDEMLVCNSMELEKMFEGKNVVLLIDELNALTGGALDADAGRLLRQLFLDKAGRYLVYSTHIPMSLDASAGASLGSVGSGSLRECVVVQMPISTDIRALQAMHDDCLSLTPLEVVLYGGIPSLIFTTKHNMGYMPDARFRAVSGSVHCDPVEQDLQKFVEELLYGVCNSQYIRKFDRFTTVTGVGRYVWPMCYAAEVFKLLPYTPEKGAVDMALKAVQVQSGVAGSCLGWEVIVQIAFILRCMDQHYRGVPFPGQFALCRDGVRPELDIGSIPVQDDNLSLVCVNLRNLLKQKTTPTLVLRTPVKASFPVVDGLLGYTQGTGDACVMGYQVKEGKEIPAGAVPDCLDSGLLIRGRAAAKGAHVRDWVNLSREAVKEFLGVSLSPLYPASYPKV